MSKDIKYHTISDVAKNLNCGPKVIRKLIKDNVIPTVCLGYRTLRIPSDGLETALSTITTKPNKHDK